MKKLLLLLILIASSTLMAEGTLKIITWKGYAPSKLVKEFEKQTGIKVKITYSNNEEMIAKLRATRGAGFDLAHKRKGAWL